MSAQPQPASVTTVDSQVGAQFRARRAALRMTQEAVAERAGVDPDTVSRAESGKPIRVANAGAIEKALTELERERGVDLPSQVATVEAHPVGDPADDLLEVVFEDNNRVVVKGSVKNLAALEELVERVMRTRADDRD